MSDFRPPGNPVKIRPRKTADFAGIGGERGRVLHKKNERGWDVSNTFFNEIYDLDLGVVGLAQLRPGKRKINDTGKTATIGAVVLLNLGGKKRYGFVYDGVLDVTDIPDYTVKMLDAVTLDPEPTRSAVASEYPLLDPSDFVT